jgi:hypothetical protein
MRAEKLTERAQITRLRGGEQVVSSARLGHGRLMEGARGKKGSISQPFSCVPAMPYRRLATWSSSFNEG